MEEINLYDLLRFYMRKRMTILIAIMIGAVLGVGYTFYVQQPEYKSTATILLVGSGRTNANQESVVINNYVELFTSRRVLDPVIEAQQFDGSYDSLAANTSAQNVKNTDIINVSISTRDAQKSKDLLESAISKFKDESKKLYGDSSIKISVVDSASKPDYAANKKPLQQIGLAVVSSAAIAIIGLFFVYDYRTQNKSTTQPQAKLDAPAKAASKKKPAKAAAKKSPAPKKTSAKSKSADKK